ncbi:hypothetical protein C4K35_3469 [Pseudomonas chlororaphis subsp. piscium]|nr:hypothetical protein C4K35_3469 [Pseudomonas chlororaphis subsp. piscium]AZC57630.1 hypothetical protein C4K34_3465 [Pseudomonas chlororaphis subsp. piscium]AZC63843.1 hypothetical protein C4K33_3351 [Pseudomonas chlororaphis subsp. piscium]AZC70081.1 hypothetical protein C4K32_3419 [Pseudomonas chlororaphis subsp. piscium]AZC76345.1 hypothetical protein C4K31_3442 [Pseudomonas chlororaphis subsp. piscium]
MSIPSLFLTQHGRAQPLFVQTPTAQQDAAPDNNDLPDETL